MDFVVDDFFGSLRDFVRRVEDDVGQLKRNLDGGYSLGPQQLKERLKDMQCRCTELETTLTDLESRSVDVTTLSELLNHCLIVHQNIIAGMEQLRIHLQNYGYVSVIPEKPMIDSRPLTTPIKQHQDEGVASPWKASGRISQNPLTLLDYSGTPKREAIGRKLSTGASLRSSSCSEEAVQCSPATLALKKKYSDLHWHPTHPSESPIKKQSPVDNRRSDSFEFRPHSMTPGIPVDSVNLTSRQDQTKKQDEIRSTPSMAVDGDAEIVDMELDRSPVRHLDETEGEWPMSDLHAIAIRDGRRPSLRLSLDSEPLQFGHPFRKSRTAEKITDTSTPLPKIPVQLYDTLPSYLRGAVSLFHLNAAFDQITRQADIAKDGFLKAASMERLYDKFILHALVELRLLKRDLRNGEMGYLRYS